MAVEKGLTYEDFVDQTADLRCPKCNFATLALRSSVEKKPLKCPYYSCEWHGRPLVDIRNRDKGNK